MSRAIKTLGGYKVTKFKKILRPFDRQYIYSGEVHLPANDKFKGGKHVVYWDSNGRCGNIFREDCFINPELIEP